MRLSEKLGLDGDERRFWEQIRRVGVGRAVEADRRATIDKVVWFLAHHQDAQGVDTWPARRALRELLAEDGGGDARLGEWVPYSPPVRPYGTYLLKARDSLGNTGYIRTELQPTGWSNFDENDEILEVYLIAAASPTKKGER